MKSKLFFFFLISNWIWSSHQHNFSFRMTTRTTMTTKLTAHRQKSTLTNNLHFKYSFHFISFQSVCVSQMNIFPRSSFIQSQLSTKMQMYVWVRRTNVWICTSGICRQHLLEVIEYSSYRYNARNVILFFAQLIDWLCGK